MASYEWLVHFARLGLGYLKYLRKHETCLCRQLKMVLMQIVIFHTELRPHLKTGSRVHGLAWN